MNEVKNGDRLGQTPAHHVLYERMFVDRSFAEQAFEDRTFTTEAPSDEQ